MPPKTRKQSGGIDPAVVFPVLPKFVPSSQLPTIKSVIGVLQNLTVGGLSGFFQISHKEAVREVAKLVYAKWYHDTVYTIPLYAIVRKMEKMWDTFREGKKRYARGGKAVEEYNKIVEEADNLFDIGALTADHISKCKEEWGVTMSEAEHRYFICNQCPIARY